MGSCSSANNKNQNYTNTKEKEKPKVKAGPNADSQLNNKDNNVKKPDHKEKTKSSFKKISEMSKDTDILEKYDFDKHLGSGAFGLVREASLKADNIKTSDPAKKDKKKFAVKTVWKAEVPDQNYLCKEIEILLTLDSNYIVKCEEVYEDVTCVHFVFELIEGGELFDFIISSPSGHLDEKLALSLFMQMVDAVHYMHAEGFMHRDIKPENFLIKFNEDNKPCIKLIDFGFATNYKPGEKFHDKVGSLNYIAPEMLFEDGVYDQKIDNWALGVCLYNMLVGKQPFADDDVEVLMNKIKHDKVQFSNPVFNSVSKEVKNLIEKLLEKDPEKRTYTGDIIMMPWIGKILGTNELDTFQIEFDPTKNSKNIDRLMKINKHLKPIIWEFCLSNLTHEVKKDINNDYRSKTDDLFAHQLFSYKEFIDLIILKLENKKQQDVAEKFKKFYNENEGDCLNQKINVFDFMGKLVKTSDLIQKEKIWNLFKSIDVHFADFINFTTMRELFEKRNLKFDEGILLKYINDKDSIKFSEFNAYCEDIDLPL